jgi:hypothetical protein
MSGNFAEKLDFCSRVVVFFLFLQKRIIIIKKRIQYTTRINIT